MGQSPSERERGRSFESVCICVHLWHPLGKRAHAEAAEKRSRVGNYRDSWTPTRAPTGSSGQGRPAGST